MFKWIRADSEKVWKFIEDFLKDEDAVVLEKFDDPNSKWRYLVEYSGTKFEIFRPKNKSYTVIVTGFDLSDSTKKALDSVKDAKVSVLNSLSVTFWMSDVYFAFHPNVEKLEKVDFAAKIYDEELDRPTLFRTFRKLDGCVNVVGIFLQMLVDASSSSTSLQPPTTMFF